MAAVGRVQQLRDVLRSTLGAERLPQPGYAFMQEGRPLLQSQEEDWPATALRDGIVLRVSHEVNHLTTPTTRKLEVWVAGEPAALGEIEVPFRASARDVRAEIETRFRDGLAPAHFLLLDKRERLIAPFDEPTTDVADVGPFAVLHRPPAIIGAAAPNAWHEEEPLAMAPTGGIANESGDEAAAASAEGTSEVAEWAGKEEGEGQGGVADGADKTASGEFGPSAPLDAEVEARLRAMHDANVAAETSMRNELAALSAALRERAEFPFTPAELHAFVMPELSEIDYIRVGTSGHFAYYRPLRERTWRDPPQVRSVRPQVRSVGHYHFAQLWEESCWPAEPQKPQEAHAAPIFADLDVWVHRESSMPPAAAEPGSALWVLYTRSTCEYSVRAKATLDLRGIAYEEHDIVASPVAAEEMRRRAPKTPTTTPQIFHGSTHVGGNDRLDDYLASLDGAQVADAPARTVEEYKAECAQHEQYKRALMIQAWQLQALLDADFCQRESQASATLAPRAGPWRVVKIVDTRGDVGTVLKAERRTQESKQERAIMLLPKPSPDPNRTLTNVEVRSLERATMLGAVRSRSLPALESDYSVTADYKLGWRFMEHLGDEVATMDRHKAITDAADDGEATNACKQAISYGLKLLAALRPLHERGLVHTALAPKHIVRVAGGKTTEYKLLGLGNLHLEGEPYDSALAPGVREYASPELHVPGTAIDRKADLYSVAMILFAAVAGEVPPLSGVVDDVQPENTYPLGYDLAALPDLEVDAALANVLLKALQPNPSLRAYADVDAMERALHDCAAASGEVFYHVYLSYPSGAQFATEAALARRVYNELRKREIGQVGGGKIRVYFDRACNGVAGHGNWSRLQQTVVGLMSSLVFVPFISRGALLRLAGDDKPASGRNPQTLASKELPFDQRLGASDEGDILLAEWQLALAMHAHTTGAYRTACQHVLPIFFGKERHGTVYKDVVSNAATRQLVGFQSIWNCLVTDPGGAQVGLRGEAPPNEGGGNDEPKPQKDEDGYFWRKPLPQQEKVFEGLFKNNAAEGMPQAASEAAKKSPLDVVCAMFSKQGLFADLLVPCAAEVEEEAKCAPDPEYKKLGKKAKAKADVVLLSCDAKDGGNTSAADAAKAEAEVIDRSCPVDWDADADMLDELARKVASVIEKAVDDQCRDLKTLGLSTTGEQLGSLPTEFTYEQLLGPKLLQCGRDAKFVATSKVLPACADGCHVVLVFGEGKDTTAIRTMEALAREYMKQGNAKLRVVYLSDDATKMECDRFTRTQPAAFLALPYRSMSSHGRRARKHFCVTTVPTVVVTKIDATSGHVHVINPDAALQVLNLEGFPWPQLPIVDVIGEQLVDADRNPFATKDLLNECQVLALYFGGEWCPACRSFMPKITHAYQALKREYGNEFAVIYVSSDRNLDAFESYVESMDWKALPYEDHKGQEKKKALSARFKVASIPTVVLLHRDPQPGGKGAFTLMPGGRDGAYLLSQPVDDIVVHQFPKWKAQQLVLTLDPTNALKYERAVSLIVLCEHLDSDSPQFKALLRAMNSVVRAYRDELEARRRARERAKERTAQVDDETWPTAMRFFIAPSPPNETTRFLRQQYANLSPATAGEDTLAPLILDRRTTSAWQACYAMRGVCEVETRPQPTVAGICEEDGKSLTTFLETFCSKIQPVASQTPPRDTFDPTRQYLEKRVCTRI